MIEADEVVRRRGTAAANADRAFLAPRIRHLAK